MMQRKCCSAIGLAACLIVSVQAGFAHAQQSGQGDQYQIASGVPGSAPYNIGVGLSTLAQLILLPEQNIRLSPTATDGYQSNLQRLIDGSSQFAIVDSISAHQAASGSGDFEGLGVGDQLMAVANLWHEVDHFIIAGEYVRSGTISDLAILQSDQLATNLGNLDATRDLLVQFGVRLDGEVEPGPHDWKLLRDDFNNGVIAGLAITGSVPSEAVAEILNQRDGRAQLLEFSQWQLTQAGEGWHAHPLTADDYPGLAVQVDSLGRSLMLVTRNDVPEETVYQVVKMMFDNLPYLVNVHESAAQISLDHALWEVNRPLHPGALRYYQQVGLVAEGASGADVLHLDAAAVDRGAQHGIRKHAGHGAGHGNHVNGAHPPEHVHDEAMLSRARAEVHDGDVILKIGRPEVLRHPETEIYSVYFGLGKTDLAGEDAAKLRQITGRIMAVFEDLRPGARGLCRGPYRPLGKLGDELRDRPQPGAFGPDHADGRRRARILDPYLRLQRGRPCRAHRRRCRGGAQPARRDHHHPAGKGIAASFHSAAIVGPVRREASAG